jgi:hypothetical protein
MPTSDDEPIEMDEELVDCVCDHDEMQHTYQGCEECDCPGHWEEYVVDGS